MIWLDGLDVPLVRYLRANFYEAYPEDQQPVVGVGRVGAEVRLRRPASGVGDAQRALLSPVALQVGQDLGGPATPGRGGRQPLR